MRRALLVAAAALILAGAAAPPSAWAHAQLISTSPTRGAVVKREPRVISFTFGEAVTGTSGAVRVYDESGKRVDEGNAGHPGTDPKTYGVTLKPKLPNGTYTATYRIVSADSHIVTGGFTFSIGTSSGGGADVGQLLSGQRTGAVTSDAFILARAVQYAAIAVGLGLIAFLACIWLPALSGLATRRTASEAITGRASGLIIGASVAGVLSAVAALGLEGAEAAGVGFTHAYTGTILGDVLATRFGTAWLGAIVVWALAGIATPFALRKGHAPRLWLFAPLVALVALPALAGHSSVERPVALLLPMNLIHVTAMTAWLGGLLALLFVVPVATRQLDGPDRTRLLAANLSRFSPLALACVIALLVTGVVQSLVELDAWGELLHTAYGRAVLIKILLLLVLIALGAQNRQRTVPRLRTLAGEGHTPGAAGVVLRRALRAEVAVIAIVLVVTGALSGYPPGKTAYAEPINVTTAIGPEQLQMTLSPAKVGTNELHIYLLDPKSGAQFTHTKSLTVTGSLPSKGIGPLTFNTNVAGPGHYIVTQAVLGSPGTWTLDVVDRVSDFDEYEAKAQVKVR